MVASHDYLCRKRLRNEQRGRGNIEDSLFRIKEAPGAHLATVPALCEMHNASEPYIPLELQFPGYIRLPTYVTEGTAINVGIDSSEHSAVEQVECICLELKSNIFCDPERSCHRQTFILPPLVSE